MNTIFFNFVDRLITLCCLKKNDSDRPPECIAADNSGISVLSIQDKDTTISDNKEIQS